MNLVIFPWIEPHLNYCSRCSPGGTIHSVLPQSSRRTELSKSGNDIRQRCRADIRRAGQDLAPLRSRSYWGKKLQDAKSTWNGKVTRKDKSEWLQARIDMICAGFFNESKLKMKELHVEPIKLSILAPIFIIIHTFWDNHAKRLLLCNECAQNFSFFRLC